MPQDLLIYNNQNEAKLLGSGGTISNPSHYAERVQADQIKGVLGGLTFGTDQPLLSPQIIGSSNRSQGGFMQPPYPTAGQGAFNISERTLARHSLSNQTGGVTQGVSTAAM
jgi:hypothetical protein